MTGEDLKRGWMEQPPESFEPMTFGELDGDDMFFPMHIPGDKSADGGFRGLHFIFTKMEPLSGDMGQEVNCVRLSGGTVTSMPNDAPVIQVT